MTDTPEDPKNPPEPQTPAAENAADNQDHEALSPAHHEESSLHAEEDAAPAMEEPAPHHEDHAVQPPYAEEEQVSAVDEPASPQPIEAVEEQPIEPDPPRLDEPPGYAEEPVAHASAAEEPPAPPPEPPPPPRFERMASPPPQAPPPPAPARGVPWIPIAIVGAIVVALVIGAIAWRQFSGGAGPQETAYVVQPYTPSSELITARDRVEARAEPDASSRIVVIFGQGVTLNVSGRVQHGLGNDWFAINWNNQTAFIRAQDAVTGSGAPPTPIVREREEEEEEEKEEEKPEEAVEEEQVAAAPSGGALGVGDVNWVREPSARDFARYFPDQALEEGQSGNVTLSCIVGGSGRLACSVASESPSGYGFGNAAIGISRQLRVRTTLPDGSSAEGREMRLPLSFRAN